MKTFAIVLLIAAALLASAQDSPTIKGHKIGESVNDYLTIENGGAENAARVLADCAALLSNPKQRRKQEDRAETCQQTVNALDGQTVVFGDLWEGVTSINAGITDGERMRVLQAQMAQLRQAVKDGFTKNAFMQCQFASRKLVLIHLHMAQDFSKVERDLIDKYGHPDIEEQVSYRNGFGAVFLHPAASWVKRPDVIVNASEDPEATWSVLGQTVKITVLIVDRSYSESLAQKDQQRPNSLN